MTEERRGTFTIIIKREDNGYTIEADGPNGIRVAPKPFPPMEEWLSDEHRETIRWFKAANQPTYDQSDTFSERLMELGKQLYEVLFHRSGLGVAFGQAMSGDNGIRLCLQVEPPELAPLPWETMYDVNRSGGSPWLATRATMPLTRRLPLISSRVIPNRLKIAGPLRILLVAASPDGLPKLSIQKLAKTLQEQLQEAEEIGLVKLDIVLNATVEALRDKLLPDEHHILLFVGHGAESKLCFDDGYGRKGQAGDPYWLTAGDVARELVGKRALRVLFLATCHVPSTQTPATAAQLPLAHQLWQLSALPAIIAMQSFISNHQANALSVAFCKAIAEGQPVDVALNHARKTLIQRNSRVGRDVFTPVLFWRAPQVRLFERVTPQNQLAAQPPAPGESPYKGLRSFEEEDADNFFGREKLTDELVELLLTQRFLAVVGASGSGKSSLLRAGIVPAFKRGQAKDSPSSSLPPQDDDYWLVRIITPTNHPLEILATSLTEDVESVTATDTLTKDLANNPRSLHLYARKLLSRTGNKRLLLVVDQFEELFTLCRDKNEQKAFVNNLLTATTPLSSPSVGGGLRGGHGPTLVVIALRADFYAHCSQFDDLREALEQQQKYIGPMNEVELRQAIEKPAENDNWRFESGLVELLLKDVGHEPGALPLLSHALDATWQRRSARTLTFAGYHDSGGVKGAIAQSADKLYQKLSTEEQAVARSIFLQLTELGDNTPDTRRRVPLSELTERARSADKPLVERVINILADARLLTVSKASIEVAHEALIREWPHLREWLDKDREGLRIHRRLAQDVREWKKLNYNVGALYRRVKLDQGIKLLQTRKNKLSNIEKQFLYRSELLVKEEEAERKKREAQREQELKQAQILAKEAEARRQIQQQRAEESERRRAKEAEAQRQAEEKRAEESEKRDQAKTSSQSRRSVIGLTIMFLAVLNITWYAYAQQIETERLANIATINKLAAQADATLDSYPQRSLLLALESLHMTKQAKNLHGFRANQAIRNGLIETKGIELSGHEDYIRDVAFSPDGQWLVTASDDRTARLWNMSQPEAEPLILRGHESYIRSVAFSPDGERLVTASSDRTARLWNIKQPEAEPLILRGHEDRITSLVFSPDGQWLVTASWDTARLWNIKQPEAEPLILRGHEHIINDVAFSPDGQWLVTASDDRTARLWKMSQPEAEPLILRGHEHYIRDVAFSPEGKWLVTASDDRTARLWKMSQPEAEPFILHGHEHNIRGVAFSPNGKWLVTASSDRTARLWNIKQPEAEPLILRGHEDRITSLAFSPDGQWLVTASWDTARLWNIKQPEAEPLILRGHEGSIYSVAFSPDGQWLVTGSQDATARLWTLSDERLIELACRAAGRNFTQTEWEQYFRGETYRKTCEDLPVHYTVVEG